MQLVRQRVGAVGTADSTDANPGHEAGENEPQEDDMEVDADNPSVGYGQSIQEMYETLKQEQRLCLIDGEISDASTIQNLMLAVLQTTQIGLPAGTTRPLRSRVATTFSDMAATARNQQRWESADRFQALAATYSGWDLLQSKTTFLTNVTSQIQALRYRNRELGKPKGETANRAHFFKRECVEFAVVETVFATAWDDLRKSRWVITNHMWKSQVKITSEYPGPFWLKRDAARFAKSHPPKIKRPPETMVDIRDLDIFGTISGVLTRRGCDQLNDIFFKLKLRNP